MTVADGRSDSGELAPTIRGPVGLQLASGLTLNLITPKPTRSVHLLDQPRLGRLQAGLFGGSLEPFAATEEKYPNRVLKGLFGFQWGVTVARRSQLGFPA